MKYYANFKNNELLEIDSGFLIGDGVVNTEVPQDLYEDYKKDPLKYIAGTKKIDGQTVPYPVINPNYEADKAAREHERISHLQCTKRVFVLMLEQLGFDYFDQIEPLINANRQARLEWSLCIELERANPLLDLMGAQLNVSPEQIDKLFQYANGEITEQEFMG